MEKRFEGGCNCLNGAVIISAEEYRRLLDASVRNELVKTILSKSDSYYMNTDAIRLILDVPVNKEE